MTTTHTTAPPPRRVRRLLPLAGMACAVAVAAAVPAVAGGGGNGDPPDRLPSDAEICAMGVVEVLPGPGATPLPSGKLAKPLPDDAVVEFVAVPGGTPPEAAGAVEAAPAEAEGAPGVVVFGSTSDPDQVRTVDCGEGSGAEAGER